MALPDNGLFGTIAGKIPKHGLFTKVAIAERRQLQALLANARKLLQEMK